LVLKRFLNLEEKISQTYKYNLHVEVLESFSILPSLFCTDILVERILPILELRLSSVRKVQFFIVMIWSNVKLELKRALPVRLACIKSLLIILRKIPRSQIRIYYLNKLIGKIAKSELIKKWIEFKVKMLLFN